MTKYVLSVSLEFAQWDQLNACIPMLKNTAGELGGKVMTFSAYQDVDHAMTSTPVMPGPHSQTLTEDLTLGGATYGPRG